MPAIDVPLRLPELAPGRWFQGPEISTRFARGAVVLVDFWEATCIHCLRGLPWLAAWHRRYAERGLVVVGVHTPEFEIGRDPGVVWEAVERFGVEYPVLLDEDRGTWQRFANHYWPSRFLADHRGYLRYEHVGEGAYRETERFIQRLLREAGDEGEMLALLEAGEIAELGHACGLAGTAEVSSERRPTPELHLGWQRGRLIAAEGYRPGEVVTHGEDDVRLEPGVFTARGSWRHEAEHLEAWREGAELELVAEAVGIALVGAPAGSESGRVRRAPVKVEVELDGGPVPEALAGPDLLAEEGRSLVRWEAPRAKWIVQGERLEPRHLRLRATTPGLCLYAVSFPGCAAVAGERPVDLETIVREEIEERGLSEM